MNKRILMLGAGGAGMAPLALYLKGAGCEVTASDDAFRQPVRSLLLSGGVKLEDEPQFFDAFDEVVFSSALKPDHPSLRAAREHGLPTLRRGNALAQAVKGKKLIAVVGSHGKTTTTAMMVHLLGGFDIPFGYLVGGFFHERGMPPAQWSDGEWVVAEIDESDGTMEDFEPEITLALNCDLDHVDLYGGLKELRAAFGRLFQRTKGKVIVPYGHALANLARETASCGLTTFGPGGDFDALPKESSQGLRVILRNQNETKEETVRAIGEFNGWNAIAALATCRFAFQKEVRGRLSSFPGLLRRQVVLKETARRIIMEDYAHHPVELTVMLRRFRDRWPDREIKVVFQPHRFSRQASLQNAFAEALSSADQVHLLPTYGAGEELIKEGSAEVLRELLPATIRDPKVQNSFSELCEAIGSDSSRPDCVLFLGAGDIELHASAFSHLEDVQWNRWLACENYLRERLSTAAEFRLNESLSDKTTLRVGGQAKIYCEPAGADDLRELIIAGRMFSMPLFALGRGSNLIVPTEGYDGIVLSMRASAWRGIEIAPKGRLVVGAGTRLKEICLFACNQSLAGFEFLEGIPGTLGGALRMNAGAMGGSMFDLVEKITLMTAKGIRREMYRDEFDARYRECPELENSFVINATLMAAAKATKVHIENRLRSFAETRMASQPRGATAGCIFRNPRGDSAGRLIDQTGLKGARVGAAEVSLTHGNFIVNRGGAKTEDVLSLIRLVRHRVKEARGIELEPEVTLMGKSWKETFKTNL